MMLRHASSVVAVSGLLLAVACTKEGADKAAPRASSSALAPVSVPAPVASVAPTSSNAPGKAKKPNTEKKPLTEAERAQYKAYHAALAQGRKSTLAKDYPAAIKAFDAALAQKEGDPRALSERGYARLLGKDWKAAREDLDKSAQGTKDNKLLATIWYNQGLISDALGESASAQLYFARSNALNPTKAAQSKLDGKSKCSARLDRTEKPGTLASSWTEAFSQMVDDLKKRGGEDPGLQFKTDIEVKRTICESDCTGSGPWVVQIGGALTGERFVVATAAGSKLAVHALPEFSFGICGGELSHEVTTGALLRVRTQTTSFIRGYVKEVKGAMVPCDDGDAAETCFGACAGGLTSEDYAFIDLGKNARVLLVSTDDNESGAPVATVRETGGTVSVTGGGCTESIKVK
jgi:hypothetical protein